MADSLSFAGASPVASLGPVWVLLPVVVGSDQSAVFVMQFKNRISQRAVDSGIRQGRPDGAQEDVCVS